MSGPRRGSSAVLRVAGPFDLALSLRAAASFLPARGAVPPVLKAGVRLAGRPAIVEIRQCSEQPEAIEAATPARIAGAGLRAIAGRLVTADLDLRPFYELSTAHPVMGPVASSLHGLKPLRPASLFEMLIVAITEQQLSLAAGFHIRRRLVERFGTACEEIWVFPTPAVLAEASLAELHACGLSRRKAEYVGGIAREVAAGRLDLAALKRMTDTEARAALAGQRGFGAWSIQYVLTRGLGRPDCLPAGDVGLRRVVGHYLSEGRRLSPTELEEALSPFAPYRSLAAYYLAVHVRLFRQNPPPQPAAPPSGRARPRSREETMR
jgi:DNA-3-methyladenine glycosylase II